MGVARIFQRGGHTESYRGYSPDCHLNIVGCLLSKRLTEGGGGVTCNPGPPWLRPCNRKDKLKVMNMFTSSQIKTHDRNGVELSDSVYLTLMYRFFDCVSLPSP